MNEHGSGLGAGVRIGEYEIVRELGFGGFGVTYLARDRVLERLVAVKEYFPMDWGTRRTDGTMGPRTTAAAKDYAWGLERFVDEARVPWRGWTHPQHREGPSDRCCGRKRPTWPWSTSRAIVWRMSSEVVGSAARNARVRRPVGGVGGGAGGGACGWVFCTVTSSRRT